MAFYVVERENNLTSWSEKREKGERFASRKAATTRARDLAQSEPGKMFEITQTVAEVQCPVGAPKITNR